MEEFEMGLDEQEGKEKRKNFYISFFLFVEMVWGYINGNVGFFLSLNIINIVKIFVFMVKSTCWDLIDMMYQDFSVDRQ